MKMKVAGMAVVTLLVALAQSPSSQFEVAVVKLADPKQTAPSGGTCHGIDSRSDGPLAQMAKVKGGGSPLGRCLFTRIHLRALIALAYYNRLTEESRVLGGPNWLASETFDIEGKAEHPESATEAQLLAMVKGLLEDRFKLQFHRETREADGFALVVARNGPKLQRSAGNEPNGGLTRMAGQALTGRNATMEALTRTLAGSLGRPIVDRTGLAGGYNFTLTWTPGEGEGGGFLANLPPEIRAKLAQADPNGPSIFTALQEQLGLRLESAKIPGEVIVIDRAERPSGN